MKKILFVLLVGVITALCLWWVKSSTPVRRWSKDRVVVSGYVPYTLVRQIGGANLPIEMLLPPGTEPHSFEPAPGTLVAMQQTPAFIYVSDRLEPWAKSVAAAAGTNTRVLELASGIDGEQDPHIWMDFDTVRVLTRRVEELLAKINPQQSATYRANLEQFEREIVTLDKDFAAGLANCDNREVVHVGHLAFGRLAKRYGLKLMALSGASHEGEHSARKLADLVQHIRRQKMRALFTEDAVSPRLAETVAAETGVDILSLYPIEHVTKNDFNREVPYAELMRRNLESLQRGLSCRK